MDDILAGLSALSSNSVSNDLRESGVVAAKEVGGLIAAWAKVEGRGYIVLHVDRCAWPRCSVGGLNEKSTTGVDVPGLRWRYRPPERSDAFLVIKVVWWRRLSLSKGAVMAFYPLERRGKLAHGVACRVEESVAVHKGIV